MVPYISTLQRESFGQNDSARRIMTGLAIGGTLLLALILLVDVNTGVNLWPQESQLLVWGGFGGLFMLAAAGGYLRAGAVPSLGVSVLPLIALFVFIVSDGSIPTDSGPALVLMRALGFGLLFGLSVGVPGYTVGRLLRESIERWASADGSMSF